MQHEHTKSLNCGMLSCQVHFPLHGMHLLTAVGNGLCAGCRPFKQASLSTPAPDTRCSDKRCSTKGASKATRSCSEGEGGLPGSCFRLCFSAGGLVKRCRTSISTDGPCMPSLDAGRKHCQQYNARFVTSPAYEALVFPTCRNSLVACRFTQPILTVCRQSSPCKAAIPEPSANIL
jgi:hypothetical protein